MFVDEFIVFYLSASVTEGIVSGATVARLIGRRKLD